MRSSTEIAAEAMRRTTENTEKNNHIKKWLRTAALAVACFLLLGLIAVFAASGGTELSEQLSQTAGGHVLAGVICFSAGLALAILLVRRFGYSKTNNK